MRPLMSAATLLIALALHAAPAHGADRWTRIRSSNFAVEGEASEKDLRDVARRLEQFREVIARQFGAGAKLTTPTPLTVVVFSRERTFRPVQPLYNGKSTRVAGYAQVSNIGTTLVTALDGGLETHRIVYHEYAHLLISNALEGLPAWLNEGLAEFFSTFELSSDGRLAVIGKPLSPGEIERLRTRRLPLSDVLSADESAFARSADRSLLYAQSWALVHYLTLGSQARARQYADFMTRLRAGAPADAAFSAAFPDRYKLEAEVADYVNQFSVRAAQVKFDDRVAADVTFRTSPMSPADVEATLGHVLLRQQRHAEAEARFAESLRLEPSTAAAHTGLGIVRMRQGRFAEALAALWKGVELADGDAMAHYALGMAAKQCGLEQCTEHRGGSQTARTALLRAVEILPEFPEALSLLGTVELATGSDLASAERHALAAVTLLPGREDYRYLLAKIYMAQPDYARAREVLLRLIEVSQGTEWKSMARNRLVELERARSAALARSVTGTAAPSVAGAEPTVNLPPLFNPAPSGGTADTNASIQFDSEGVEFGPWLRRFIATLKHNWAVPFAALTTRGHVVVSFRVQRNGSITDIVVLDPSSEPAFSLAARAAVEKSSPVAPLPPEYPSDSCFFSVTFYYNETPIKGPVAFPSWTDRAGLPTERAAMEIRVLAAGTWEEAVCGRR
jgi:TonB family protein